MSVTTVVEQYYQRGERVHVLESKIREWKEARKAMCEMGMSDPNSRSALNRLSEAEDALSRILP